MEKLNSCRLGQILGASDATAAELGGENCFTDIEDPGAAPQVVLSGHMCYSRLLRNGEAAATLAAGNTVKYEVTGGAMSVTDVVLGTDNADICGVVDPFITAAVQPGEAVNVFFSGPSKVQKAAGAFSAGALLQGAASARVDVAAAPEYEFGLATIGRLLEDSSGDAGTLVRVLLECPMG